MLPKAMGTVSRSTACRLRRAMARNSSGRRLALAERAGKTTPATITGAKEATPTMR